MEILKRFVGNESIRKWMNEIQQYGEYVLATNLHILVRKKGALDISAIEPISNESIMNVAGLFEAKILETASTIQLLLCFR